MVNFATTAALFTGAWNLVNVTWMGMEEPLFGPNPVGVINYAPNGYMSVCLQSNDALSQAIFGHPEVSLLAVAYTGPFSINRTYPMPDARHGQGLHGPLISTNLPGFVGATFPREFAFSDDGQYLTLSAELAGVKEKICCGISCQSIIHKEAQSWKGLISKGKLLRAQGEIDKMGNRKEMEVDRASSQIHLNAVRAAAHTHGNAIVNISTSICY